MITLNVDYLHYNKIVETAEQFLLKNKIKSIPVNIEHIIEFNYDMDIIPTPGLQSSIDIDGFTTSDFSAIYVDEFVYNQRYYRYRFTLAHELAHRILHKKYFNKFKFNSIVEWENTIDQIDQNDHSKIEFQAYAFAGLVLVPRSQLNNQFIENSSELTTLINQAKEKGLKKSDYLDYALDKMSSILSPIFEVSISVMNKRIEYDSLINQIP